MAGSISPGSSLNCSPPSKSPDSTERGIDEDDTGIRLQMSNY